MLNLKYLTMPAAAPLAGSLLALVLCTPASTFDNKTPCDYPARELAEIRAESKVDAADLDLEDYPSDPPLEWALGPQSPAELAVPDYAQIEGNGVAWQVLREGDTSRATPGPRSVAKMRFVGWTTDGEPLPGARALTMIPMEVPLDEMVPGFSQAAQRMHPGERRRVWVPQELAFDGREGRPEGALIYDMELVSWND